ncbi:MAG: PD-(D/E)XK nuclease family protein [Eubacterium sp.]|nr:PD-(D/E)XK nuclease family protein [Eubacterium sp.]
MKANGMEIAADTKEQLSLEYLKIYQIVTKPSMRLYISWAVGTNTGDKLEKSEIADKLVKMFKIKPEIYSEEVVSPQNKEIFVPSDNISYEIITALTGETLTLSSSKLDKYVKCPFSYYLRYVLGLEEERVFEINAVDRGNILHGIMEKFFKETEDIYDMTAEEINRRINEIMPEVLAENLANITEDGKIPESLPLLKYSVNRIEKTADTSVLAGLSQLKKGKFVPTEFEVSFGSRKEDSLPPVKISRDVNLVGKIDRVDVYEEGDNVYVKITDYKSSVQTLDMTEIYNGLKLQLLLYLSAYTEEKQKVAGENKTYHPAGLMYFSFSDPILKESEISGKGKTVENVKLGKFKPVGIFSDEAGEALGIEGSKSKNTDIIPEDDFKEIMNRARKISAETGEKIKKGVFPVKPYIYSGRRGCDYCPYSGICEINTDESRANVIKKIEIE